MVNYDTKIKAILFIIQYIDKELSQIDISDYKRVIYLEWRKKVNQDKLTVMTEATIARENLMTDKGYTAYCGAMGKCSQGMPRTMWDKDLEQFTCSCGWVSQYSKDFIDRYKKKWNK